MEISFFEEFPTKQALDKLKMVDFPTKIYIAAHSLKEFNKFRSNLNIPLVYWVILPKWAGYWVSPFSARPPLLRALNEVRNEQIKIMLDLENPVHAPWLYVGGLPLFWRNKRFIKEFIEDSTCEITLVELSGDENRLKFWGLHYDNTKTYVVKMVYTSLKKWRLGRSEAILRLKKVCEDGVACYGSRFKIGLGCIAKGVAGIEPLLLTKELGEDLYIAKEIGVQEAIIFRLAGLNDAYIEAIKAVQKSKF